MLDFDKLEEKFKEAEKDQVYDFDTNELRPTTWKEYIGNTDAKTLIRTTLVACKKRGSVFPHTIISGQSGTGKTTLGYLIASAQNGILISAALPIGFDEWAKLCAMPETYRKDVIILDEIHLQKKQPEILYPALEEGIFIINGKRIPLPDFTCIGATTELGEVKTPLRNRFTLFIKLSKLTIKNMETIINQGASKYAIGIDEKATEIIARASNAIPRDANSLLTRCRDMAEVFDKSIINEEIVNTTFEMLKITRLGLDVSHIRYLDLLHTTFSGDRIGLSTIAATLGENPMTISLTVEPKLLNLKYVLKTPRGRQISEKGISYLNSAEAVKLKEE